MEAVVHPPAEGERHIAGESEILIKATGNETAGTFFLSESTIAPGFPGPPMHRHERLVDMFYVLEGFSPYVSARTRTSSRRDRSSAFPPACCTRSPTRATARFDS